MERKYAVSGMSCAACSARVERAVRSVGGVEDCAVNLLGGAMTVTGEVDPDVIIAAVRAAGYGAELKDGKSRTDEDAFRDKDTPVLIKRLLLSLGFLIVLMYFSMGHMLGIPMPSLIDKNPVLIGFIQLVLSGIILIINRAFFIGGTKSLVKGAPNMDTLVAMGSAVSYGYSVYILILMCIRPEQAHSLLHGLYFESAAMILALITLGKTLEAKAKGKTTSALRGLISLSPKTACLLVDGKERIVSVEEVKCGDVFVVRPGETIPTDATVIEGEGAVDESMLTGESIPVDKTKGSVLYGASVNKSGYLVCRATGVGEDTVLSGIIKMVSDASATKAPIAKIADKVSGIFVPTVLGISLITLFGWLIGGAEFSYAIERAISVTVISCPCALGLATPVAIMVGSGVGAKRGILFKNATALESAGRIKTVVLDKTGTVTSGHPTVTDVIPLNGTDGTELLELAYSLEYMSEHPLARAVCEWAENEGANRVELDGFKAVGGRGVSAYLGDESISGVSLDFAMQGGDVDFSTVEICKKLSTEGKTPLCFMRNEEMLGVIAVADEIKADAPEAINYLKSLGVRVVMLTGDGELTARAVAKKVGIDEVIAGVLPDGKADAVKNLQKTGQVCMVGDGINDAPALTASELGVAVGAGTDIAIDAADVVLIENRLSDVPKAIALGRAVLLNVKENLFWAFLYNLIGIPLAAGLFGLSLNPMFGAAAMSLSSFSVVMNALRLNLWKPKLESGKEHPVKAAGGEKGKGKKTELILKVEGMMCPHCEARVKNALETVSGVELATPDHKANEVAVLLNGSVSEEVLRKAITEQGYTVL